MSSQVAKAAGRVTHELHGVVVSAGLMQKTVKVRVGGQKWNKVVNKVRQALNEVGKRWTDSQAASCQFISVTDKVTSGSPILDIILYMIPTHPCELVMLCPLCLGGPHRVINDML